MALFFKKSKSSFEIKHSIAIEILGFFENQSKVQEKKKRRNKGEIPSGGEDLADEEGFLARRGSKGRKSEGDEESLEGKEEIWPRVVLG